MNIYEYDAALSKSSKTDQEYVPENRETASITVKDSILRRKYNTVINSAFVCYSSYKFLHFQYFIIVSSLLISTFPIDA